VRIILISTLCFLSSFEEGFGLFLAFGMSFRMILFSTVFVTLLFGRFLCNIMYNFCRRWFGL
jgi:hypothetical protein